MSTGDLQVLFTGAFGEQPALTFRVASGTTASINAGEPVAKALGNSSGNVVSSLATNKPVVGTDFLAGVATTTSTETASAAGTVSVQPLDPRTVYLISPNNSALWDTQAEYNALVGARVLLDKTSGAYTILASDSANNGCVVEPLDISLYPGKVAFSFRSALFYKA